MEQRSKPKVNGYPVLDRALPASVKYAYIILNKAK
jgi:hypothetical protein